jgi:UDP-N-acetylglucosamine acyltransferase
VAYCGLNIVGLRRRGFAPEVIDNIHNAYRIIYGGSGLMKARLQQVRDEVPACPEVDYIISFFEASSRGVIK